VGVIKSRVTEQYEEFQKTYDATVRMEERKDREKRGVSDVEGTRLC